ncbi:MAG: hypothetical protein MUC49_02245 [Raineya sp.]|jgi:hypothetical protein|nr:hypothetical protein [Raineya sp.]
MKEHGNKKLIHEKYLSDKGISPDELPKELKEVHESLKDAKKEDFEETQRASILLMEAIQEYLYDTEFEEIGEVLADHEERISNLEKEEEKEETKEEIEEIKEEIEEIKEEIEKKEENQEEEKEEETEEQESQEEKEQETQIEEQKPQKSKEEVILEELFKNGTTTITEKDLKLKGFRTGFTSKLSARGGKYGSFELVSKPFSRIYTIKQIA